MSAKKKKLEKSATELFVVKKGREKFTKERGNQREPERGKLEDSRDRGEKWGPG